jgi:rhamnose utilization protein RhaD (predicted bifunctional aldolase and dehydrogenase)
LSEAPAPYARLEHLWNENDAAAYAGKPLGLLRYRSNLLGADLRVTNFGGGNTSAKFDALDPLTGTMTRVLAVKGSGGDLGSIAESGFAVLRLGPLEGLVSRYRGVEHEDEMVPLYPLCALGAVGAPPSIDTALHALLPHAHIDHLHPDWAIAIAASANGERKLAAFNARYNRRIVWIPWQRPGFELAMVVRRAVERDPACDGLLLASHGLFTWGETSRACYHRSITTIEQMGEFVDEHRRRSAIPLFGGPAGPSVEIDRPTVASSLLPRLRGRVSPTRRVVAHWDDSEEARTFAGSAWAEELCRAGTSCPDHFLRTRISPMFVPWDGTSSATDTLPARIDACLEKYRDEYVAYYRSFATPDSPVLRDANPSVVVIPQLGLFGFGRNAREARVTTEFFANAIRVMAGATALEDGDGTDAAVHNYAALSRSEAFRIEYWALEDAKLRRMPPERELSRMVALIVGGGSGIGRWSPIGAPKARRRPGSRRDANHPATWEWPSRSTSRRAPASRRPFARRFCGLAVSTFS